METQQYTKLEKPIIYFDYRERNETLKSQLFSGEFQIKVEPLAIGDVMIADIVIERKAIADFIASLVDGRLFNQLYFMKKTAKRVLLIIEGLDTTFASPGVTSQSIKGALIKAAVGLQVPVLRTISPQETGETLIHIARQEFYRSRKYHPSLHKKPKCHEESSLAVLRSLPFIGSSKAKLLMKHFKTLKNIFCASVAEPSPSIGAAGVRGRRQ